MEITFREIKPYLRFVRYVEMNDASRYAPVIPYDARLFYVLEGEGRIRVDGQAYPMRKNSLLFINSGVEYHMETPKGFVLYVAINFDLTFSQAEKKIPILPAAVKEYDNEKRIENVVFSDAPEFDRVFYVESMPSIEKKLVAMEKEYARKLNMYELKLSASMMDVFIQCYRCLKNNNTVLDDNELAARIIKYVSANFEKKLTNGDVARYFNYHPNYISFLVKQYTGYPLAQYIHQIRIAKATEMLSFTEKSLLEIADRCGYCDTSHFVRRFKQVTGLTPKEYRSKNNG
jgi:AraC-like DNA-binding protein